MADDRRKLSRIQGPFDATWSGGSGGHPCRVLDLSTGGCYLSSLGTQVKGSPITVTLTTPRQETLVIPAIVTTVDPGMGFSVEFRDESEATRHALKAWVDGA